MSTNLIGMVEKVGGKIALGQLVHSQGPAGIVAGNYDEAIGKPPPPEATFEKARVAVYAKQRVVWTMGLRVI